MHNNWDIAVVLPSSQQPVGSVVLSTVITNIFLNICCQIRVFYTNNPAEVDSDFIKAGEQKHDEAWWKYSATLV